MMTTKERMTQMYEHKEADRVPIIDYPWQGTLSRWHREGMLADVDWRDYFGVDKQEGIGFDITPQLPERIIKETDRYVISTTAWGVTLKNFKEEDSTPEFLDYEIHTPEKWEQAKKRMTVDPSRINWDHIKKNYPIWQAEGRWIEAGF